MSDCTHDCSSCGENCAIILAMKSIYRIETHFWMQLQRQQLKGNLKDITIL